MKKTATNSFLAAAADLESALANLPSETGKPFYGMLEVISRRCLPPLYAAYDDYVAGVLQTGEKQAQCRSGCSACCRHYVTSVEPIEILAIHFHIHSLDQYPDLLFALHGRVAKFKQILVKEIADNEAEDRALHRYFLRGVPCPFLDKDEKCGIYASRPMACRMFFSASAPRFCAGKGIVSPWNKNFQVELPDEAEEALARCAGLLEGLELPEGLFAGLLEANALFGRYEV
jgi:Fe-S-cluster containining protein